ncbi:MULTISPECIES: DNA-directed RNA polymerase subunit beta [unclassified Paenibacillus]|uniref:DNA-directed RNA polymerase subunit beta n=1 Tax=unclassified Paenibacillus TaxID=185978 RepID=UPI0005A666CC|nr:DNA-directed RNA polymerase subunit beta [Paenibacillus sp. FSL R5-0345]
MERKKKVKSEDKPEDKKETKQRGLSKWTLIQWILIPLLLVAALGGGLVVGYVVLGKKEFSDVLQWSTWRHVYDLVFAP